MDTDAQRKLSNGEDKMAILYIFSEMKAHY